jgi:hypothetical protein
MVALTRTKKGKKVKVAPAISAKGVKGKAAPVKPVKPPRVVKEARYLKPRSERKQTSPATVEKIRASLRATLMNKRGADRVPMVPMLPLAEQQQKFLDAYLKIGTIHGAAKSVHMSARTHYAWLQRDDDADDPKSYVSRFKLAHEAMVDTAEEELRRRGIVGVDEPVFYQGEKCGTVRKYSDAALIFYLKGRRGDVFKDRSEITGKDGAPLAVQIYIPDNRRTTQVDTEPVDALPVNTEDDDA